MAAPSAPISKARAKTARLSQSYPPDHPKLIEARRNLKALRLEEYVQKAVSEAPELSPDQLERIAALLRAGGGAV